ncbi:MAG: hypothetical protein Q8933_15930 [Bacteroidota bacterium]|nr:hypothetical protein [Bacteroidota bacterium]MDP4190118.1 hypothetical protein [Bacteroidota bacterium]MDP4193733.1 hypothetical protein [Bacteroidota bacterium]
MKETKNVSKEQDQKQVKSKNQQPASEKKEGTSWAMLYMLGALILTVLLVLLKAIGIF